MNFYTIDNKTCKQMTIILKKNTKKINENLPKMITQTHRSKLRPKKHMDTQWDPQKTWP